MLLHYIHIYICVYRYNTITDVYTTALLLTKPSSDDDSGFRHGFGTEASLPLAQSTPAGSHNTTSLCQIVVTLWDCHIHADAVRALSWILSMYFLLSDRGSPRLVKNAEVELAMKPLHPTSIGNTFVIQPFLTHCSRRSSYFSNLYWCAQSKFSSKGTINSITKSFLFKRTKWWYLDTLSLMLFQLEIWSYVWTRLWHASPSSPQTMMVYAYFLCKFQNISFINKLFALLLMIFTALLAVSRHTFEASAKISRTSLCL